MSIAVELIGVRMPMSEDGTETDFTFTAEMGEWVALVGSAGSGKSLILKLCAGLVAPEAGTLRVLGVDHAELTEQDRAEFQRRITIVLQQPGLLSNLTAFNNVALPLRYHRHMDETELESVVMSQLDAFGVASLRDRFPAQLNSGQARCVALARAFAMQRELVLLDDPTGGLDAEMMYRVADVMADYKVSHRATIIMTARAPSPLLARADRVAFVRAGHIESDAPALNLYLGGLP
jgi:ABC-type transporter Mla maintaining outer membrane lipid asymmetry ATPase subunit MlaF